MTTLQSSAFWRSDDDISSDVERHLILTLVWVCPTYAQSTEHRDTAFSGPAEHWSIGVFNPLELQLADTWSVRTHPLAFFAAPHVDVHHRWMTGSNWALKGIYGLSVPSWTLKFEPPFGLRGTLTQVCGLSG